MASESIFLGSSNVSDVNKEKKNLKRPPKASQVVCEQEKKDIAKLVQQFPCLWDKQEKSYRNQRRREESWKSVSESLNISSKRIQFILMIIHFLCIHFLVSEAKKMWKKARDTHRYFMNKQKKKNDSKSGAAAPEDEVIEEEDNVDENTNDMRNDLAFLDATCASNLRETATLGGRSSCDPDISAEQSRLEGCETPLASAYSYASRKSKTPSDKTLEAVRVVSESISTYVKSKESSEKSLQFSKMWSHLDELLAKLPKAKATRLCAEFTSMAYAAVLEQEEIM